MNASRLRALASLGSASVPFVRFVARASSVLARAVATLALPRMNARARPAYVPAAAPGPIVRRRLRSAPHHRS
ncbi:MAG: hypothetical protein IPJ77_01995 [Planctomycetes bacterium]|nr:hypothetical protein [Planctomycetota bacterium]